MSEAISRMRGGWLALAVAVGLAIVATALMLAANVIWFHTDNTGGADLSLLILGSWALFAWAAIVGVFAVVEFIRVAVRK